MSIPLLAIVRATTAVARNGDDESDMGGNANPFAATVARITASEHTSAQYVSLGDEFRQLLGIDGAQLYR